MSYNAVQAPAPASDIVAQAQRHWISQVLRQQQTSVSYFHAKELRITGAMVAHQYEQALAESNNAWRLDANDQAVREYFIAFLLTLDGVMTACSAIHGQWIQQSQNKMGYLIQLLCGQMGVTMDVGAEAASDLNDEKQAGERLTKGCVTSIVHFCIDPKEWSDFSVLTLPCSAVVPRQETRG